MKAIVVGCGRIGAELVSSLFKRGHDVSVVDENQSSFNNLPPDFQGRLHEGDALNQDVLTRAGIANCDALAAVTNNDALNAVISHIARVEYRVPTIIARNYDPHLRALFETFDIQVVSSTSWGAQRIEELLMGTDVRTVFSAGNGEVEVYELVIPALWDRKKVSDLIRCNTCKPLAVARAGKAFLPDMDTELRVGDLLNVSATFDGIEDTRLRLREVKKEG
ncbi:MAG: TrkA family potassium uptake protein [Chloroflexi bacterium]|nr:TrkA family potassium uptake protein [Chloroflexota bacterium]